MNSCVPFIASQFLACRIVSFDPTLSREDTKHLMKQLKPNIIFVSENAKQLFESVTEELNYETEIVIFGNDLKHTSFTEFLTEEDVEDFEPVEVKSLMDTAVIIFSSGTSGLPKGICLNHYGISCQSRDMKDFCFAREDCFKFLIKEKELQAVNVSLSYATLYWISTVLSVTTSILYGYCRLLSIKFDPQEIWYLIEKWKVSALFLPPHLLIEMARNKPKEPVDISSISCVRFGGSSISKEQIIWIRNVFKNVLIKQACGQTEISGSYCNSNVKNEKDLKMIEDKPDSIGRAIKGFTYKVTDLETGEALGPYKTGELRLKTKFQMNGYLNLDSSHCWDVEGFLKTGDVVYYDEENWFYFVDRIKEMLKYKSWHVTPASIEAILLEHPAVHESVVVGVPHDEDGDHPCAFVVLKKGIKATSEEIMKFVNEKVEDRKKLRGGVYIVEKLDVTPSGKIKRNHLKDLAVRILKK